jgi:hypothetical protein
MLCSLKFFTTGIKYHSSGTSNVAALVTAANSFPMGADDAAFDLGHITAQLGGSNNAYG